LLSGCQWRHCAITFGADCMSSYFLRRCLGFSLLMCLGFVVVLAYLGAEFMYNQWEKKRMHAYRRSFLWLVQCGTTGKRPSFCCKDVFVTVLNFRFMLCLFSTQQFSPLPVLAITWDKPGSANAWITSEKSDTLMQCKRIRFRVRSAKNEEKRTKVKCWESNIKVVWYPMFRGISHQTAFLRSNWH
jgi:hypothetical protein